MNAESRTAKSIKNSIVALAFYFINLILQFFSRKIFLECLGTEILGLNTTATNLLQFLNLAELGIGSAIACTLYKPILEKDTQTINEILSLQGWMYRHIALVVGSGALILMAFFPLIFAKMPLPLWYAYASFSALLVSALLSYFVNYKQVALSADQKDYKIQYSYKLTLLVKIFFQIFAVKYLNNGYVWWLILEVCFAVIASWLLSRTINKTYPYLKTEVGQGSCLRKKYPDIIVKIKQLFFHKIATYVLSQTSTIIIYAYTSLTLVALYGNYMLIILGVTSLMAATFNSMNAGVGNLVAQDNKFQILKVFNELFSLRFWLSCSICFGVYTLTPAFITLWIGDQYIMDNIILLLMVVILYINLSRSTVDSYLNAYGLFRDVWAPIVEASINIGMSILLGHFWGIKGILTGVLISLIIIVLGWKPYFLFRCGLKSPLWNYIKMYAIHLCALAISIVLSVWIIGVLPMDPSHSIWSFIECAISYLGVFSLLLLSLLLLLSQGIKNSVYRFKHLK